MATLTSTCLTNVAAFRASQRPVRQPRRLQRCFAMADDGEERKLSFESNKRAALGYTESDSAGQTNIFAVEPKTYVAGSSLDKTEAEGSSTNGAAAIAGTVAAGAVLAGLLVLKDATTADVGPTGDFLALSQYKAQFAAEIATAAPAPAAAPAIVDTPAE